MLPRLSATPLLVAPGLEPLAANTLRAVSLARFAPVHDLLALFGLEGLTSALLDAWVAAGFLHLERVALEPLKTEMTSYVALTAKGAKAFAMTTGRIIEALSKPLLRRSAQTRAHEVAKGAIALAMLAAEREGLLELAGLEAHDKRLATSTVVATEKGPIRIGLQADLLVAYGRPRDHGALLVEVDRGTVSLARMELKYSGYLAWKLSGGPERDFGTGALRILTVVPDARRLEQLHATALRATDGRRSGLFLFALQEHFSAKTPEALFEPIARVLDPEQARHVPLFPSEPPHSLLPRAATPQAPRGSGPRRDSSPAALDGSPPRLNRAGHRPVGGSSPELTFPYAPIFPNHPLPVPC